MVLMILRGPRTGPGLFMAHQISIKRTLILEKDKKRDNGHFRSILQDHKDNNESFQHILKP